MDATTALATILALLVGLAVGALAVSARLRAHLRASEAVRDQLRRELDGTAADRDAARGERDALRAERSGTEDRLRAVDGERVRLGTLLEQERRTSQQREARLAEDEKRLREAFSALSRDALAKSSQDFMTLAETRLAQAGVAASGDLAKRQQAIEGLVAPLRETLGKVEEQMQTVERSRVGAYRDLLAQVGTMRQTSEQLTSETRQLVTALRAPQTRGRWGEMQLEQIVRAAGMVEHCDFDTQPSIDGEHGRLRPDLIVHLAGGKEVIVDAKVSFVGYLDAMEARDDMTRTNRLIAHARHLREHVDSLAAKSYWQSLEASPEFVVMFVPAEVFLNAALDKDPTLLEHAFERNVVIATPSTLIALLRTVSYTWRQEALAANAAAIHKLGKELHGRLATMGGHVAKLGSQLGRAVDSYNLTVSSLESRVLVSARKLTELQVSDAELTTPEQVTSVPRRLQAEELVASANDALIALPEPAGPRPPGFGQPESPPDPMPERIGSRG